MLTRKPCGMYVAYSLSRARAVTWLTLISRGVFSISRRLVIDWPGITSKLRAVNCGVLRLCGSTRVFVLKTSKSRISSSPD